MKMFRKKQLTPGRPKPGTVVAVEVRTTLPNGKFGGWAMLTYMTSNLPKGGHADADELIGDLQATWDQRYVGGAK